MLINFAVFWLALVGLGEIRCFWSVWKGFDRFCLGLCVVVGRCIFFVTKSGFQIIFWWLGCKNVEISAFIGWVLLMVAKCPSRGVPFSIVFGVQISTDLHNKHNRPSRPQKTKTSGAPETPSACTTLPLDAQPPCHTATLPPCHTATQPPSDPACGGLQHSPLRSIWKNDHFRTYTI